MKDDEKWCPTCQGTGKVDDGPCSPPGVCYTCGGTGKVKK